VYTLYNLFKFLHVAGVILWIGGLATVAIINVRMASERNIAVQASLANASAFFGKVILGPAAGTTLIAGIVMVLNGGLDFATLWIAWGLLALIGSMALGATLIRRASESLNETLSGGSPNSGRLITVQRRLRTLNTINLILLLSAVWVMVFKPTL
jgi:uncharacterized membrane protein